MAHDFRMIHRVEFADTDMAGIIHFSSYFRYMEVTEHAFFRSLGFSIAGRDEGIGWPRVHVSCDFRLPLRFEDEVEVQLIVREKKSKSLTYDFVFRKVGSASQEVARGSLTAVCVRADAETGQMKAATIPESIAAKIEAAPSELQEG